MIRLDSIRKRSGLILVVVGLALFAFVIDPSAFGVDYKLRNTICINDNYPNNQVNLPNSEIYPF